MNMLTLDPDPTAFPDQPASFTLRGPAGTLETLTDVADPVVARRGVAVV